MASTSERRYILVGYDSDGFVQLRIPSSRKQLAITRSMVDLGAPNGDLGRWEITSEIWLDLALTFDWPDRDESLTYFLESKTIDQDAAGTGPVD
ncbi:hypothetical protein ACIPYS_09570 [Kitasatospora sp. NPDC089913]|uniref:hypothetical protein n=1 Tax=Kitasatospora sp. NPDC089913 TaxID=3364080 RepID=UPI00381C8114